MKKRQSLEQLAPKGRNGMSVDSVLPASGEEFHQTFWARKDCSLTDEITYYIEQLGIPFLKVNQKMMIERWTDSLPEIMDVSEEQLNECTIEQLVDCSPMFKTISDLVHQGFDDHSVQEGVYEEEDALIRIRSLPTIDGKSVYVMLEDRSLQKQFENLLTFHHQMEAVSHIAAGVAHELRNPLSVIKGFLQLAQLTNDFQKYYDTILSELNRMNGIIEDFLSVSRKKIDRKPQSPIQIMESLEEIMKAECLLHNVEFKIKLERTTSLVHVNESMVKQVMLNLLRNSVEAFEDTAKKRLFWIETKVIGNKYCVYVQDNGKGIPEDVLKQLGKPFFTTKDKGTGIGIPLCKKIIEDHGGTFEIKSQFNTGTTVILTLPLSD
ncbi:two-component system sensor histidine kinase NtrB [Halalkalibacter urbisdiaboli]|uniref:two-component system sensor histidine kinase NtrB n=1 Tax=Halalkalibacter urbisdiaboli TaxID=1960589 RepID=UPI000B447EDD|nr:ATP-binding protein [Halalkalibacter urbisdiaboli]